MDSGPINTVSNLQLFLLVANLTIIIKGDMYPHLDSKQAALNLKIGASLRILARGIALSSDTLEQTASISHKEKSLPTPESRALVHDSPFSRHGKLIGCKERKTKCISFSLSPGFQD